MFLIADISGERLDAFLARTADGLTRSAAQRLIEDGFVKRNGKPGKKNDKLNVSLPDKVMIQIIDTKDPNNILKQKVSNGLADAFEIGTAWLERANRDKA